MLALLGFLGLLSFFAFLWLRIEPLLTRLLVLAEQKAVQPAPAEPDPIPADLLAYAYQHEEEWAREQTLGFLRELRDQTGSWNSARTLFLSRS